VPTARRPIYVRAIVGTALAAFLLGGAATWLLVRSDGFMGRPVDPAIETAPLETAAPAVSDATPGAPQAPLDDRIAAMEERLARLDLQASAAAGNVSRAESLLIAFASRRAIERGAPLGFLEDQLRLRFSEARPNAVETVIASARDPVTLDQLLVRLDGISSRLTSPPRQGPAGWLSRELGDLFVIRRRDAPSPAPERRLERARLFLESGRAGAAAAEIRHLPEVEGSAEWIEAAQRYSDTQRALELLELTAILEPRELRNAEGEPVTEPSAAAPR
jgi:hypothetical protein